MEREKGIVIRFMIGHRYIKYALCSGSNGECVCSYIGSLLAFAGAFCILFSLSCMYKLFMSLKINIVLLGCLNSELT